MVQPGYPTSIPESGMGGGKYFPLSIPENGTFGCYVIHYIRKQQETP
jgi:hypothetical protein